MLYIYRITAVTATAMSCSAHGYKASINRTLCGHFYLGLVGEIFFYLRNFCPVLMITLRLYYIDKNYFTEYFCNTKVHQ